MSLSCEDFAIGISHPIQTDIADAWMRHMRGGKFEEAWRLSDQVLRAHAGVPCRHLPRHLQYVWDGTPLAGRRVLLRCYHGLGDTIQFIRYAALVKEIAAKVLVWAQPALMPLLGTMDCIDRLLALHDGTPDVEYDLEVEVMELPHVFRTTLASLPAKVPYLHVAPAALPPNRSLNVGLVWRAGDWDPHRCIPFPLLLPLTAVPNVTWYILQHGSGLAELPAGFGSIIASDDLLQVARNIRALDLLITVDTMAAHLAGALAVPVWTLLRHNADWRWMERRADNPWYPTMRLFRQEREGAWEPVIARVATRLGRLSADKNVGCID